MQDIQSTYGKNALIAKELDMEVKRAKAKQQMESIAPAMKVVAVAGFVNDAFDVYDAYQQGGIVNVAQTPAVNVVAGKLMETVTSRRVEAVPSAGPVPRPCSWSRPRAASAPYRCGTR